MAEVKYIIKENNAVGTHSFYASAHSYSTLDFKDLAEEVTEGTGIDPDLALTVLNRYMRVAKRNVLRGHRVRFGDMLTIYPQISCSVKDEVDKDGNIVKVATADMLNIALAKGSIGATVSQSVQQSFAASVSWKRLNASAEEQSGNSSNEDDNQDASGDNAGGDNGSSSSSSSSSSDSEGGGDTPTPTGPVLTITKTGSGTASVTDQTGHQIDSGDTVTAGQTVRISVTPSGSDAPTATLGDTPVTLMEDEGQYVGTFQMPDQSATLTIATGE